MAVDFTNGSADNIDIYQMQTQTLLAGLPTHLKNKDLLKNSSCHPGDIIRRLFLAGEIADLTAQITELNGYTTQEKADKAVKLIRTDGEVQAMYLLFREHHLLPSAS